MNMQNQFNKMSVLMSNNFRKYPKTKARRIQGHSSTSLQIQGHSRP